MIGNLFCLITRVRGEQGTSARNMKLHGLNRGDFGANREKLRFVQQAAVIKNEIKNMPEGNYFLDFLCLTM